VANRPMPPCWGHASRTAPFGQALDEILPVARARLLAKHLHALPLQRANVPRYLGIHVSRSPVSGLSYVASAEEGSRPVLTADT